MNALKVADCYKDHVVAAWLTRPSLTRRGRVNLYLRKGDVVIVLHQESDLLGMSKVLSAQGIVWVFTELLKPL